MKKISYLFSLFSYCAFSQAPVYSVFLIGDTGELKDSNATFTVLQNQLIDKPNSTVIFLGDNVYPNGLIEKKHVNHSHEIILKQLRMFNNYKGNVFFIPGNHDWMNSRNYSKGKERLGNEERFIEKYIKDSTTVANKDVQTFLPSDGQPGPSQYILYDGKLKVIFIDTQWFMYLGYKTPSPALEDSTKRFFARLDQQLADAKQNNQQVVVVGHHPVYTNGSHSKLRKSPELIKRWKFQDLSGKIYSGLAQNLDSVFKKYPGLVYAAGHDHLLEYFRSNGNHYIVSGAGSKTTAYSKKHPFNPADPYHVVAQYIEQGFFTIDYFKDGSVRIALILSSGLSVPMMD